MRIPDIPNEDINLPDDEEPEETSQPELRRGFEPCPRCKCEVRIDQTHCPFCGLRMCDNCG
jgi:hypothetical protein